jgi:hypothetical protein
VFVLLAAATVSANAVASAQTVPGPPLTRGPGSLPRGGADVLQLIDAERVYAEVQRAVIDLRLETVITIIEARFALGEEAIP